MGKESRMRRARRTMGVVGEAAGVEFVVHVCVRCGVNVSISVGDDVAGCPVICARCFARTASAAEQLPRLRSAALAQLFNAQQVADAVEPPEGYVFSVRYAEVVSADHLRAHVSLTTMEELPSGALVWPLVQ